MADVDFDSAQDESQQASSSAPDQVDFDDAPDESVPDQPTSSPIGAFVRHGIREFLPNLPAAAAGDIAGTAVGAGVSATATPVAGIPAGFLAAAGAAAGTQEAADAVQEKLLDAMGLSDSDALGGLFNKRQAEADVQQHPYITGAADIADALATFNVGGVETSLSKAIARRAIAGGAIGALTAGQEKLQGADLNPGAIAESVVGGALLAGGGRKWLQPAEQAAERFGAGVGSTAAARIRNIRRTNQNQEGQLTGRPNQPVPDTHAADQADVNVTKPVSSAAPGVAEQHVGTNSPSDGHTDPMPAETIEVVGSKRRYDDQPQAAKEGVMSDTPSVAMTEGEGDPTLAAAFPQEKSTVEINGNKTEASGPDSFQRALSQQPDRRVQDIARQDIERRAQPQVPKAQQGQEGLAAQPLPDEILNHPNAQPGAPPMKAGEPAPVEGAKPIPSDYPRLPEEFTPEQFGKVAPETKSAKPFPEPPAEEALALHVQKAIDTLRSKGMDERADALAAMPEKARNEVARQYNKRTTGMDAPENRPKVEGLQVQARTAADAAMKKGALDALQQAHDKFPPQENESTGQTLDRAKDLVNESHSIFNGGEGKHPLDAYKPRVKPGPYQLVREARQLLKKPTQANVEAFRVKELALRSGGEREEQALRRQEADEHLNKRSAMEPENRAPVAPPEARVTFPDIPEEVLNQGRSIDEDRQGLHDYLNNLSDDKYAQAADTWKTSEHPFEQVVRLSTDPNKLQRMIENDLDKSGVMAPRVDATEEGLPVTKRTTQKAPPVEEKPPVTGTATSRPDLFAAYNAEAKPLTKEQMAAFKAKKDRLAKAKTEEERSKLSPVEKSMLDGDKLSAAERAQNEATDTRDFNPEALTGSWGPTLKKAARMFNDTSGSLNLHKIAPWLYQGMANIFSPRATPEIRAMVHTMHDWFVRYSNDSRNTDAKLVRLTDNAPPLTHEKWVKAGKAWENRDPNSLAPDELEGYKYLEHYRGWYNDLIDTSKREYPNELPNIPTKLDPTTGEQVPVPYGGLEKNFMPRERKFMERPDERKRDLSDTGKDLSSWRPAQEERDFHALSDGQGNRMVVKFNKDGDMTLFRQPKPGGVPPPGMNIKAGLGDVNPGDTVTLNIKGKPTDFTVDHATREEIENSVNNKANIGTPLEVRYEEHPLVVYSNKIRQLDAMLQTLRMLDKLKDDPTIKKYSFVKKPNDIDPKTGLSREVPQGYKTTRLPEMATDSKNRDIYYHKRLAYMLDDFNKQGLGPGPEWVERLRNATHGISNTLYFFGPYIHAMNEGVQWSVARGSDWIKPTEYYHMFKEGMESIHSVRAQDGFNDDIRKAGGNPMLASTILDQGAMRNIAQKLGVDMAQNPSVWDPLSKAVGVDVPNLGRAALKTSNYQMWFANDVLLQSLVRRNLRQGVARDPNYTMKNAVDDAHKFISDYREREGTFMGSRGFQQFMLDPVTSWFGRYHIGLFRTIGHMFNQMIKPEKGTNRERAEAAAQMAVLGAITWGVLPMINKGLQWATGNDNIEIGPRGMSTVLKAGQAFLQDPGQYPKAVRQVWTPSIPAQVAMEGGSGADSFTHKELIPAGSSWGRAAGRAADYAAQKLVPPYAGVARSATRPDSQGLATVGKEFAGGLVGIHEKTPGSVRFERQGPKRETKVDRMGRKKPGGLFEAGYNWLTRK